MSSKSLLLSSFFLSLHSSINNVNGGIYHDPITGEFIGGATMLPYCYQQTQVCETHFGKNVFATENPIMDRLWTEALFPDMYNQFDDDKEGCGFGSKFISMDTCAQIHQPMTTYHDEANLKVHYVQEQYTLKWNNVMTDERRLNDKTGIYDSFFDNSVAYWVSDIGEYETIWKSMNAEIIYLRWKVKTTNKYGNKYFYSMITHHGLSGHLDTDKYRSGSTLTQYELISDTFSTINDDTIILDVDEQRAYFDDNTDYSSLSSGCNTYPIGPRRAVSSLSDNIDWYSETFSSTIVDIDNQLQYGESIDYNGNKVKYAHLKLHKSEISASISFFERDHKDSTYGEFKVKDFEDELKKVHESVMVNPFCGIDRWFDMHYAVDFNDVSASEEILENIMYSGKPYTLYGDTLEHFLYMPEPNGHSIQVVFENSNDIELKVSPFAWTWCHTNCSDDQLSYSYGDAIFDWTEKTKFGRSKLSQQLEAMESYQQQQEEEQEKGQNNNNNEKEESVKNTSIFSSRESLYSFIESNWNIFVFISGVMVVGLVYLIASLIKGKNKQGYQSIQ